MNPSLSRGSNMRYHVIRELNVIAFMCQHGGLETCARLDVKGGVVACVPKWVEASVWRYILTVFSRKLGYAMKQSSRSVSDLHLGTTSRLSCPMSTRTGDGLCREGAKTRREKCDLRVKRL